uniref:Reverse transcriptase/retrotransposon-derived protein RNase H-like domain-containing protein n=1 Tax=Arundo donax TaxID=35708 RepID=A0A0A8Z196_ARUDO
MAFQALKDALTTAPILAIPNFSLPFCIETDASAHGVRAVLMQQGHPLAFISRPLGPWNRGLSTYEKEYMAILIAVDQWCPYLQQGEFVIHTDQRSLIHLNEQCLHTPWQQKVFNKLLRLQYRIEYKKGTENWVVDALSHRGPDSLQLFAVSSTSPQWLEEVVQGYQSDPSAIEMISKLSVSPDAVPSFSFRDGLLRYKDRIWLGTNKSLQARVISAMHDTAVGGHSGVPVTYRKLKQFLRTFTVHYDTNKE